MIPDQVPRIAVIGGGAAGFFGAIACAEGAKGEMDMRVLEMGSNFLTKVKISGGGRCNVTHGLEDTFDFAEHYPRGKRELIGPLSRWSQEDTVWWFRENGVELKTEEDGRIFPVTDSSVLSSTPFSLNHHTVSSWLQRDKGPMSSRFPRG
jgi:hypothetical protein